MANRSSNTAAVPEAKGALDKFKFEVASELGVPLSDGYNGNLTSKQNNILMPEQASKSVSSFLFGKAHAFFLLLQSWYIILTDQCFRLHHH